MQLFAVGIKNAMFLLAEHVTTTFLIDRNAISIPPMFKKIIPVRTHYQIEDSRLTVLDKCCKLVVNIIVILPQMMDQAISSQHQP